jgi:hypothetical protein
MHVGVANFSSVEGAAHAFANAHGRGPAPGWMADAAVVEVHRHGRVVVRGTIAGRYVDIDGASDAIGRDTGIGALAGAAIGFGLGPPAFALGVVGGTMLGGAVEAGHVARQDAPGYDAVREQLPEESSAVVAFSDAERVGEMARALEGGADAVVQYRLTPEAEAQVRTWVAEAPPAAPAASTERTPQMEDMVITARFTDAGRARRALQQLKRFDDERRLRVRAGALLERSGQDRISLTGTDGEGAFMPPAGIVGMLIDAVTGPPDTVYARPDEGFYGRGGKPDPDDELALEEITRNLEPGVTLVIAEIVDPDEDVLEEALGEVGGTISRRPAREVHAELEAAERRA